MKTRYLSVNILLLIISVLISISPLSGGASSAQAEEGILKMPQISPLNKPLSVSAEELQSIYDSANKVLLSKDEDAKAKEAIADDLIGKFNRENVMPAVRHAAAYAMYYALLPWHTPAGETPLWNPSLDVLDKMQKAAELKMGPQETPDAGTRRYLIDIIGMTAQRIAAANDTPNHSGAESLMRLDHDKGILVNALKSEPEAYVAERALRFLIPFYNSGSPRAKDAVENLAADPNPAKRRLVTAEDAPDNGAPIKTDAKLEDLHRSADTALSDAETAAKLLSLQGKNIAVNYRRDAAGPQAICGSSPWGGGGDCMSLLAGPIKYNNNFGYNTGPALPPAKRLSDSNPGPRWQTITIDLKEPRLINTAVLVPYGEREFAPKRFKVYAKALSDPKDLKSARQALVFDTDEAFKDKEVAANAHTPTCNGREDKSGCKVTIIFPKIIATEVTFVFDGKSTQNGYVWLQPLDPERGISYQPENDEAKQGLPNS